MGFKMVYPQHPGIPIHAVSEVGSKRHSWVVLVQLTLAFAMTCLDRNSVTIHSTYTRMYIQCMFRVQAQHNFRTYQTIRLGKAEARARGKDHCNQAEWVTFSHKLSMLILRKAASESKIMPPTALSHTSLVIDKLVPAQSTPCKPLNP
jgi:hypothetical protein